MILLESGFSQFSGDSWVLIDRYFSGLVELLILMSVQDEPICGML